jgi:hypothetical protein
MREFWVSSGHHLTRLTPEGRLAVTDELLLAWLARPELVPPQEACAVERALHAGLVAAPRAAVGQEAVAGIADADARENWAAFLAFRDDLLAAGTVEAAYLDLVRRGRRVPGIFREQLVHLVMRNALDGIDDPFVLRAAELFWRPQRAAVRDGALVLSDAELVEELEAAARQAPLMAMFGQAPDESVEVMTPENAWTYWSRSDAHVMALPFGAEPRARAGLAGAIAAFLRHLLGLEGLVEPMTAAREVDLRWYVGLDADATGIGDALWRGERPAAMDRLVGIFALRAGSGLDPALAGHPVYLLMATGADGMVRLKPQNLIMGLPLAAAETMH